MAQGRCLALSLMLVAGLACGSDFHADRVITLSSGDGGDAHAIARVDDTEDGQVVQLDVSGLPDAPKGTSYELWFVGEGDTLEKQNRVSAGTFTKDGVYTMRVDADPKRYPAIGVTEEPKDGAEDREGPKRLTSITPPTIRISEQADHDGGNGDSTQVSITPDGRFIAFASLASNLVPNDTNQKQDVFVFDRENNSTKLISVTRDGKQLNGDSNQPKISPNGEYIAFASNATNVLLRPDSDRHVSSTVRQVYLRDRPTNRTTLIESLNSRFPLPNGHSRPFDVTSEGQVYYGTLATNWTEERDTNGGEDLYRFKDEATCTAAGCNGPQRTDYFNDLNPVNGADVSMDGGCLAVSTKRNPTNDDLDRNSNYDVYLLRVQGGSCIVTTLMSRMPGYNQHDADTINPSITDDAISVSRVAFETSGALEPEDTNRTSDVFIADARRESITPVSVTPSNAYGNGRSGQPRIAGDGRTVVFSSLATDLVSSDTNRARDIFSRGVETRETFRVTGQANGGSAFPVVGTTANNVAFQSDATNLIDNDVNNAIDIFVFGRLR